MTPAGPRPDSTETVPASVFRLMLPGAWLELPPADSASEPPVPARGWLAEDWSAEDWPPTDRWVGLARNPRSAAKRSRALGVGISATARERAGMRSRAEPMERSERMSRAISAREPSMTGRWRSSICSAAKISPARDASDSVLPTGWPERVAIVLLRTRRLSCDASSDERAPTGAEARTAARRAARVALRPGACAKSATSERSAIPSRPEAWGNGG